MRQIDDLLERRLDHDLSHLVLRLLCQVKAAKVPVVREFFDTDHRTALPSVVPYLSCRHPSFSLTRRSTDRPRNSLCDICCCSPFTNRRDEQFRSVLQYKDCRVARQSRCKHPNHRPSSTKCRVFQYRQSRFWRFTKSCRPVFAASQ